VGFVFYIGMMVKTFVFKGFFSWDWLDSSILSEKKG
jgi:hypothetical protein